MEQGWPFAVYTSKFSYTVMYVYWNIACQVPAYVAAQLAGSTLAVLTLAMLLHEQMNIGVTVTQYSKPKTHCEAFAWEFILSFILMLTICGVAADNRAVWD